MILLYQIVKTELPWAREEGESGHKPTTLDAKLKRYWKIIQAIILAKSLDNSNKKRNFNLSVLILLLKI